MVNRKKGGPELSHAIWQRFVSGYPLPYVKSTCSSALALARRVSTIRFLRIDVSTLSELKYVGRLTHAQELVSLDESRLRVEWVQA